MTAAGGSGRTAAFLAGGLCLAYAALAHWSLAGADTGAWALPLSWLYYLQHLGINASLGLLFGRSLRPGHLPLVTYFAGFTHPELTPALRRYTRQVTIAWTLFFVACIAVSALLFFLGPLEAWSLFANVLTLPLVAAMFVAENEVRKRVLPPEDQVGILAAVRAFRSAMRS
jgi:uncharacterized membrane protein